MCKATLEHQGVTVTAQLWIAEDGAPVVQIDTDDPLDDTSNRIRVYLNDARASQWIDDLSGRTCEGAAMSGDE